MSHIHTYTCLHLCFLLNIIPISRRGFWFCVNILLSWSLHESECKGTGRHITLYHYFVLWKRKFKPRSKVTCRSISCFAWSLMKRVTGNFITRSLSLRFLVHYPYLPQIIFPFFGLVLCSRYYACWLFQGI